LAIRNLNDIDFVNDRCIDFVDEFTSTNIFISELADPNNNLDARFIELYNAGDDSFSLKGWLLGRYTNANTELSSIVDLSDYSIAAKDVLVIAANAVEFRNVYGFEPDLEASGNSPANSNGDDNIELIDPFGAVIDIFGVVGEDGTQTNHEFEDGRAVRNSNISQGNAIFTFAEPEDFSPGIRD